MEYSMRLLSDKARSLHGKTIESLHEHVDTNELKRRISIFQNIDIQRLSDKELEDKIDEVLSIEIDGGIKIHSSLSEYSLFDVGTRFYRVRKLINTDMPNRDLKKVSSYWNPPQKYVNKYGRLNKPRESLLYTALNPCTAIRETNLMSGNPFVLCVYEAIKPLRFSWIGGIADYDLNRIKNKKTIESLELMRKFLVDEFTRVIPDGQESLYRITEIIAKKYYTFPDDAGWRYPSIKNNYEDNICFHSERVMYNVKLVGALIATLDEPSEKRMFVEYVVVGPNMDIYYPLESKKGEEYMEKLFPEISKIKKQPANR